VLSSTTGTGAPARTYGTLGAESLVVSQANPGFCNARTCMRQSWAHLNGVCSKAIDRKGCEAISDALQALHIYSRLAAIQQILQGCLSQPARPHFSTRREQLQPESAWLHVCLYRPTG